MVRGGNNVDTVWAENLLLHDLNFIFLIIMFQLLATLFAFSVEKRKTKNFFSLSNRDKNLLFKSENFRKCGYSVKPHMWREFN